IACQEIVSDPQGRNVSLRSLVSMIAPLPGEHYPLKREELALYAVLTSGRGKHAFALELTRFVEGEEVRVDGWGPLERDLGQDPTTIHGLPIRLRPVRFPQPGQYTFRLLCDHVGIAEEKILLREER